MKSKVKIHYNSKDGYIIYKRNNLYLGSILKSYDSLIKIVDFDDGLLTVLMKRGNEEIEEYVDLGHCLTLLYMKKEHDKYFKGISVKDIVCERN